MTYVDGFVLVVPRNRLAEYRKLARESGRLWMKHGALDFKECMLDDAKPRFVTFTFPKMTKVKKGETVWFSYIVYKSKKHRDKVNANVWKDPSMKFDDLEKMPYDIKRMAFGGFKTIVEERK